MPRIGGTSIPRRDVEERSTGSGPVISYQLSPEELEKWKEGFNPMLTRDKYLRLRIEGMSRTHIQRNYYPSNPTKFYNLLTDWGIKEKDAEERALDLVPSATSKSIGVETASDSKADAAPGNIEEKEVAKTSTEDAEIERLRKQVDTWKKKAIELERKLEDHIANQLLSASVGEDASIEGDNVNHPAHYTAGSIECIDAIESATTGLAGGQAYSTGAAIKYLWRWSRKGGVEDLQKARWYIDRLIGGVNVEGSA